MAQAMLYSIEGLKYLKIQQEIKRNTSIKRKKFDSSKRLTLNFANSNKNITMYYSKFFKNYIISFNIGKKKFIMNRLKWKYFESYIDEINKIFEFV